MLAQLKSSSCAKWEKTGPDPPWSRSGLALTQYRAVLGAAFILGVTVLGQSYPDSSRLRSATLGEVPVDPMRTHLHPAPPCSGRRRGGVLRPATPPRGALGAPGGAAWLRNWLYSWNCRAGGHRAPEVENRHPRASHLKLLKPPWGTQHCSSSQCWRTKSQMTTS